MTRSFKEAIAEMSEAARLDPENERIQFLLGNLCIAAGNKDAALSRQRKLEKTNPQLSRELYQAIYSDKLLVVAYDQLRSR